MEKNVQNIKKLEEIECPKCGTRIAVSEALSHQMTQQIEEEVGQRVKERLTQGREKLEVEAKKRAEEAVSIEVRDIREQLRESEAKRKEAEQAEFELRKRERVVDQKEKNIELETERRIAAERLKVQEETEKAFEEKHRLKDAERDMKLQEAIQANEVMRRKLEQGSQQTQGEVLELQIEELLRASFPSDAVEPVPKGRNGADVIHRVFNRRGDGCGVIVWESKHTKAWQDSWVQKLKDDLRLVKGDVAVLVTENLPKGVQNFGLFNGVWVTCPPCAFGLAVAIRGQLIEVTTTKLSAVGKNEKMEMLYHYLSGPEFKQRIEAMVESIVVMEKDLQEERRTTELRWSKRAKQIQRMITNTAGVYGDFQGLIGSSLQTIPALTSGEEQEEGIMD